MYNTKYVFLVACLAMVILAVPIELPAPSPLPLEVYKFAESNTTLATPIEIQTNTSTTEPPLQHDPISCVTLGSLCGKPPYILDAFKNISTLATQPKIQTNTSTTGSSKETTTPPAVEYPSTPISCTVLGSLCGK